MGCGKSTLGRELAPLLKRSFIDLDKYIEEKEGKSISEIFSKEGEQYFRTRESLALQEIIIRQQHAVIALGGGTVCHSRNMRLIRDNGWLVYLQVPAEVLTARLLKQKGQRPLLQEVPDEELHKRVSGILKEREPYYEQAHMMLSAVNLTAPLLHQVILAGPQQHSI